MFVLLVSSLFLFSISDDDDDRIDPCGVLNRKSPIGGLVPSLRVCCLAILENSPFLSGEDDLDIIL